MTSDFWEINLKSLNITPLEFVTKKMNFVALNKTLLYWLKMEVTKCPKRHTFFNPVSYEEFLINMLNN